MKSLIGLIIIVLLFSYNERREGYSIEGNITGLSDGDIFLLRLQNRDTLNRATAKDGYFVMKENKKFLGDIAVLSSGGKNLGLTLFLEPGKIKIIGEANASQGKMGNLTNPEGIIASGTPSNDAWNTYNREIAPLSIAIDTLRQRIFVEKDTDLRQEFTEKCNVLLDSFYYMRKEVYPIKYNATILAPYFLSAGTGNLTYEGICKMIDGFSPDMPENWYTNRLIERREILRQSDIGQTLPDFTLPMPDGTPLSLSALRGKVLFLDFWASWCGPCRKENKNIIRLYKKYHEDGFDVMSVSIDTDREKWVKAIEYDSIPWTNHVCSFKGWDCPAAKQSGVAYGMTGIPYTLLLDSEGKVIAHNVRGEALEQELEKIFKRNPKKNSPYNEKH